MTSPVIPLPKGFSFATAAAGFKRPDRDDLALIVSEPPAAACDIAAAMMEFVGPQLCKRALQRAGETEPTRPEPAR